MAAAVSSHGPEMRNGRLQGAARVNTVVDLYADFAVSTLAVLSTLSIFQLTVSPLPAIPT